MSREPIIAGLALVFILGAADAWAGLLRDGDPARGLRPVPPPDTVRMPERSAEALEAAEAEFDHEVDDLERAELGLAYGMMGIRYQAHELNAAAEPAYRNAMELAPDVFNWRYYLAFLEHETGEFEAAIDLYLEALELRPDYWPARMRIGLAALEIGDLQTAERSFREVLSVSGDEAAALAGLGRVAAQRGEQMIAVKYLERALELQPSADRLHYRLGLAYRQLGRMEEARSHLEERGSTDPVFADEQLAFMQARARPPEFFRSQAARAMRDGGLEEARFNFELAVEIDPASLRDRLGLIRVLLMMDDLDAAADQLSDAARHAPDAAVLDLFRGHLAVNQGRDEVAVSHYRAAATGGQAAAWAFLGDALMRLGRHLEAADAYGALMDRPGAAARMDAGLFQAVALLAAGECERARGHLADLPSEGDTGPSVRMLRIRADVACQAATPGDRTAGLEAARTLNEDHRDAATAETLAMALAAAGDTDSAAAIIREILFQGLVVGQEVPGAHGLEQELADYEAGRGPAAPFYPGSPLTNPRRVP